MKHLIFDFDGTIVDSANILFSALGDRAEASGLSWDEIRDLPSSQALKALGFSKIDLPRLILTGRKLFAEQMKHQELAVGFEQAAAALRQEGYKLHIVSSNSKENIVNFLEFRGILKMFDSVTGFFTIFGKAHGIRHVLGKIPAHPRDAIYIGDETRDIDAAKKVGVRSLAACWGFNSAKILAEHQPDLLCKTTYDMVAALTTKKTLAG